MISFKTRFSGRMFGVILSGVLITAGCAGRIPEPSVPAADARAQLSQIVRSVPESMRMMTRVDYVDGSSGTRVVGQDLVLSVRKDGLMRVTISAFDKAVSTLVSDGKMFALMDVTQNVFAVGHATPENISRVLPVQLSAADFHRVIQGGYPTESLADNARETAAFAWDESVGGYRSDFALKDGGMQSVYQSWPDGDVIKMTVRDSAGSLLYVYEASDFRAYETDGVSYRYPQSIIFRLPVSETDVRLRVDKRDLNPEFSEAVFRLEPPKGAKIVVLDGRQPENR